MTGKSRYLEVPAIMSGASDRLEPWGDEQCIECHAWEWSHMISNREQSPRIGPVLVLPVPLPAVPHSLLEVWRGGLSRQPQPGLREEPSQHRAGTVESGQSSSGCSALKGNAAWRESLIPALKS